VVLEKSARSKEAHPPVTTATHRRGSLMFSISEVLRRVSKMLSTFLLFHTELGDLKIYEFCGSVPKERPCVCVPLYSFLSTIFLTTVPIFLFIVLLFVLKFLSTQLI
jgi:hypothetical protein